MATMTIDDHSRIALWYMARQAEQDDVFTGWALRAFRERHGLHDDALAGYLGCAVDALPWLALSRRPDRDARVFIFEVALLAAEMGCDAARLRALLLEAASAAAGAALAPAA